MSDFAVVTCVSNPDVYDRCLLSSVKRCRGRHDVAVVPIINDGNLYSAANALNLGIDIAKSDLLIFAHQDVALLDSWFDTLVNCIKRLPDNWAVIGAAGIAAKFGRRDIGPWGGAVGHKTVAVGSVWSSDKTLLFPPYWDGIKDTTKIHCADECLFVFNKRSGLRFDRAFQGFHFYGVDLCLQARAAGKGVYGSNLPIVHFGDYSASLADDQRYWAYLRYLHNKWRFQFPTMLGTHMHWATDELTSYIPMRLQDQSGLSVGIKAMGIKLARFKTDKQQKFVEQDDA